MTVELGDRLQEVAGDAELSETDITRLDTLIGSVIRDASSGHTYPGLTVTFDEASNNATWSNEYVEATASQTGSVSTFREVRKIWDESGCDSHITIVSLVGSEARVSRSVVRNTGQVLKREPTKPLDRATYDNTTENLVDLKVMGGQEAERPPRRLRFGWFRIFTVR